ncbi:hypothetical protein [Fusibacter ferrireducens]|nr:hypothetical protein [Fusibacter ferrireducens]
MKRSSSRMQLFGISKLLEKLPKGYQVSLKTITMKSLGKNGRYKGCIDP